MKISLVDTQKALKTVSKFIRNTELKFSTAASNKMNCEVWLKMENEQRAGSFKVRGAMNFIANLSKEERKRGLVAISAGNHAQGVAISARDLGCKATIVMPKSSPLVKLQATRGYGAEVFLHGNVLDECKELAEELVKEKGYVYVHPFLHPLTIAGQGTVALEIIEDLKEFDSIVVPIGGGGLISGIATVVRALLPKCKIYGVQAEATATMADLFYHRPKREIKRYSTLADGISVKSPDKGMFDNYISKLVDDIAVVNDEEIAQAMVFLLERSKTVSEGSGAAAMAAVLAGKLKLGKRTVAIVSGGNIDLNKISMVIEQGLSGKGRRTDIAILIFDQPGVLSQLTKIIGEQGANILEVHHKRFEPGVSLGEARIEFRLETLDEEHIGRIRKSLKDFGARVVD